MTARQLLEDTVKWFSEDTTRRCVSNTAVGNGCFYSPTKDGVYRQGVSSNSTGCAIGRFLSTETGELFDKNGDGNIDNIMDNDNFYQLLPEWMKKISPTTLNQIQEFHDDKNNWGDNGLSPAGIICYNHLKSYI